MLRSKKALIAIALMISVTLPSLATLLFLQVGKAQLGPIVMPDPPVVEIGFCETADIAICVEGFTDLWAFEFKIWWLKDVVEYTGYEWKPYPPPWVAPITIGPVFDDNGTHEAVMFGITALIGDPFSYSGRWPFIDIYWHCIQPGVDTALFFDRDLTNLYDETGMLIPIEEIIDGLIINEIYWKENYPDYAPSGVPDFDQRQDNWGKIDPASGLWKWTWCGPTAVANSLWWMDSRFEPNAIPPPTISDGFPLLTAYGGWDDHDLQNAPPFISDLGWYMDTDGIRTGYPWSGTDVHQMEKGISMYLRDRGLETEFVIKKMKMPDFYYIEEEVERCEDVILLLGIWQSYDGITWWRVGGHYVTVPGVDSPNALIAFSDPCANNAEAGGMGRVLPLGVPHVHPPPPVAPPQEDTVHNNASFVSHDIYSITPTSPSPGGTFAIEFYEPITNTDFMQNIEGQNCPSEFTSQQEPWDPAAPFIATEVEYSVIISPADWYFKAEQGDYAPSGMPDFDQKQWLSEEFNWTNPYPPVDTWSFCGPVAEANSLWWLDSEFEPNPIPPPEINDGFPLVTAYGKWDDHDPQNAPYLIEDLAWYMDTNGMRTGSQHCGTELHDMEYGIDWYLRDHGLDWKFYEHTEKAPDFYWIEEEIERCQDVVLLLGFWQNLGTEMEPYWIRNGGHYVTCAGVDSENMMLAISDPFIDNAEWGFPGRVIPPPPHPHTGPPETLHNNATYVSHDFYLVGKSPSPGGPWGLYQYPAEDIIDNFDSCQNTPEEFWEYDDRYVEGLPVYTEIEYAVVVSCETGIVVAGNEDTNVYVWDFVGNLKWQFAVGLPVVSVAMDNQAHYIAAGTRASMAPVIGDLWLFDDAGSVLWTKPRINVSTSYDGGWAGTESKSVDVKYNVYNQCVVVAAATDQGLYLYDEWGNLIFNYIDPLEPSPSPMTIVRISQDGNYIICARARPWMTSRIYYFSHLSDGVPGWSAADGQSPVWTCSADDGYYWVAISGLGDYVAASRFKQPGTQSVVELFNKTGALVWDYLVKPRYVRVDMPCHGRSVVAANDDPTDASGADLYYWDDGGDGWDSGDSTPVWTYWPSQEVGGAQDPLADFYTVAISENGDYVATGGAPANTYLLTKAGVVQQIIANTPGSATQSVDLTFTGKYGASGDYYGVVWFFDKDTGLMWSRNTDWNEPIHSIAVSKLYPCMFPFPDHDLNVTDVTPDSVSVTAGTVVNVNVTVTNEGDFAESFFDVFLEVLSNGMPQPDVSPSPATVASLASGASTNIAFTWNTTGLPQGNYLLVAKASIVQDETDVYDNTFVNGVVKVTVVVPPPPPAEDLELYPREVVDLEDPTGTQWHELHPNKTNYYYLTSWEPGKVLSPEDQIDMYAIDPPEKIYVFTDFVDPSFPICSEWFEEFPMQQWWHLSSWEDNNGDGYLSECDQIDMTNLDTGEVVWFHVQFIDPPTPEPGPRMMHLDVKYFFQVDEVTVDMTLSPVEGGSQIFVDYKCGYWTFDPKNPICTKWNEIDPEMGPVRCLHLTSWEDGDVDGELSPGDIIDMTPLFPTPGPVEWYYVDFMSISLMLTPKPSPPVVPPPPAGPVYLESEMSYDEFDLTNPMCTYWHEIHPVYSRIWHLSSWEDRLGFSPSDQIVLALKDEFGEPIPGTEAEYHVDKLTVAMNLTSTHDGIEHIVKFEGSLKQFKVYYWTDPISTQWHEVNPTYCRQWHLYDWLDENPDGLLGFCDYILMMDKETGDIEEFHVESLSTDMYVTQKVHDVAVIDVLPFKTIVGKGYSCKINVTVANEGYFTSTFNVTLYANTTEVDTQKVLNLAPGTQITITLTWNTSGFAYAYTITVYATPDPAETDLADNTFIDGVVKVSCLGDLNGDYIVDGQDYQLVKIAVPSMPGSPKWNPNADLNDDGIVDGQDFQIVKSLIGTSDP